MRLFRRKPQEHNVTRHDVRPSLEESLRDAQGHSPTVAEELRRPLG